MDTTTVGIIISSALAVTALSVQVVGLDDQRRSMLATFWKLWAFRAWLGVILLFSSVSLFSFWTELGPITRPQAIGLVMSVLNLISVPSILLMDALLKMRRKRDQMRDALFDALVRRVEILASEKSKVETGN